MKKLLILLTLIVFAMPMMAQETVSNGTTEVVSEYVTDGDVEKLVDKYSAQLEASITSLAETLRQPAEYVYTVLVKQQIVEAWTWLIVNLILLLTCIVSWMFLVIDSYDNAEEWYGVPILFTVLFILFLVFTLNIITSGFINPEYGAIKDIANLIPS